MAKTIVLRARPMHDIMHNAPKVRSHSTTRRVAYIFILTLCLVLIGLSASQFLLDAGTYFDGIVMGLSLLTFLVVFGTDIYGWVKPEGAPPGMALDTVCLTVSSLSAAGTTAVLFIRLMHTQVCAGTHPTPDCPVDVKALVSIVMAINGIAACLVLWFIFPDKKKERLEDEERALHEARVQEVNTIMIELTQPPRTARAHRPRPAPQDLSPPPSYEDKNKYEGFEKSTWRTQALWGQIHDS